MHKSELSQLLEKYSRGQCTEDEQAVLENWFASLENNPDDPRLKDIEMETLLSRKMLAGIKARVKVHDTRQTPFRLPLFMKVAATLLLIALMGSVAVLISKPSLLPVQQIITLSRSSEISITNTTDVAKQISLSDGTFVTLQPRGGLVYPQKFEHAKREIQLTGEAFFDVAKDSSRPFIITTKNITVKVLGTSFNVKAYEGAKEAVVAVKTGRVLVFRPQSRKEENEIILTPNQEVVYNTVDDYFSKKIVSAPKIILEKPTLLEMAYDNAPVDKILTKLEENYGIDIVFDSDVLSSCTLTTSMAEEGFYERIEIICRAIGAQYEIRDATIVITSSGCR